MEKTPPIDQSYLLETLRTLVAIDSTLPREEALAAYIADQLKAMGVTVDWDEVAPGRPNVCATANLGPIDRFLVFSGHSDTVAPAQGWETDPFALHEEGGRLYGLGVYNMKAGLACALAAFKALVEDRSWHGKLGRLGLAVTVDQEGHSIGSRALLKTPYGRCDAMLHAEHFYGDSPSDYLPMAATGKILYKIAVKGRAAHAFRPHLGGINAVEEAARIVAALKDLQLRPDPLFGQGTVCTLKIEGGYKEYAIVVPEHCEIIITRLTVPGETEAVAVRDMQDLIDALELESEVAIETPPPSYEPYFLDENTPLLKPFGAAYQQVLGQPPHFAGHRGITDASVFVGEGRIPTVVFGPKGADHHCPGEYVEQATLLPTARVYAETACRYLAG
ncbi:MAG: M20/M25/M40 family metallo-hydrolase [Candidatus Latescibacteria bacterium]|nr:M20/M25/M40 family metallo-hydrolase [Candidatus Latescibacterota bacterium]